MRARLRGLVMQIRQRRKLSRCRRIMRTLDGSAEDYIDGGAGVASED